ncbi:MAG: hypothetical protein P8Q36_08135 [Alphaproteobacteria bacterium]|nr:hypothetical protein [Alphaproteobacteria bacterium]
MNKGITLRVALRAGFGVVAVCLAAAVVWLDQRERLTLQRAEFDTGWILLGAVIFLALFNVRKKLSMIPLGRNSDWLAGHISVGVIVAVIYAVHVRDPWPSGYEFVMALLFYVVMLSGICGYILQRVLPRAMTNVRNEFIWERIPLELATMREEAESLVMECARDTGSDVLPRLYREDLEWFFRKPRFVFASILHAEASSSWARQRFGGVESYLSAGELDYFERLRSMSYVKGDIDRAFAVQGLLKVWLLVHVPATYAFLALVVWHVILIHVYLV